MFQRIKQFYWDITSVFYRIDYGFINTYLTKEEIRLFNELNKSEKCHSIRVAKFAKEQCSNNIKICDVNKLMKICLLHDIGKGEANLNVLDRTFIVLAHKITKGKLKKYTKFKKINIYYNHPKIAIQKLNIFNYDDDVLYAIENHHKSNVENNWFLNMLKLSDENN